MEPYLLLQIRETALVRQVLHLTGAVELEVHLELLMLGLGFPLLSHAGSHKHHLNTPAATISCTMRRNNPHH